MRVPLSWLKDYVDIDISAEELAERLTLAGLEVGKIIYIGVPQQEIPGIRWPKSDHLVWDRDKILLAAIREVKPHPDADKLVLAMVDYGGDELEQCVTGAPNLHEYAGKGELDPPLWTPFAKEGATVWDGHSDEPQLMVLQGKELRGIYNKSMVMSEKELGISDEHEGILLLDHDADYVPGTPLQDVLGDIVLDIELTPNLGHNFSLLGVAREVAALTGGTLKEPSYDMIAEGDPITGQVAIDIREPDLNPRFVLAILKETEVQRAPFWMRYRLKLLGQRPINNFVDVTNYITFEIGQPLHAFDYDKLVARAGGKAPTIITRLPEAGEALTTLDDVQRELGENQILVCDEAGVLSLGGIIGGAETEISDTTTNVLLEGANWNFINIRKTQQAQKVFTEAGTRFSRNIHPSRAFLGVSRGIELMRQLGGGKIGRGLLDEYPNKPQPVRVDLPIGEVQRLLGMDFTVQAATDILTRLLFDVTLEGDVLHVTVPDYRTDIGTGVVGQADLVEEIVRVYGYDKVPTTLMNDEMPPQHTFPLLEAEERVRDLLVTLGLSENISYRLTTPDAEAALVPPEAPSSLPQVSYIEMANPISADKTVMRHTLLVGLLEHAVQNARFKARQQIFEIGSVFLPTPDSHLPDEPIYLSLLITGPRYDADWASNGSSDQHADFFDMKGIVEELLIGLHIADTRFTRSDHTSLHPGRSAALYVGDRLVGHFGELHPLVAQRLKLTTAPVIVAEFNLEAMIERTAVEFPVRPLPLTPPIFEDLALVVDENTPAAEVAAAIREAGGDLLKDLQLFDVYRGENIGEGKKSLAYALTYQTDEKTLKDKDVAKLRKQIIKALDDKLGAKLRA